MINRQVLLTDLQSLLRKLEADLLARTDSAEVPEVGEWLRAEYKTAKDAGRTAASWKEWLDDFITQVAAAWVLSCVFARFAEDNELVEPPRLAGSTADGRLQRARDEYELYFRGEHLQDTAREYLLDVFAHLASLPAGKDLFGEHNPLMALPTWLGPDAAGDLLRFFQKIDSDSGQLVHDFTDPNWDTRFLGDLYQDLSAAARKKYALLQTPDFVEEFILDRTLEPALDEFGLTPEHSPDADLRSPAYFKVIDPACGSGHFLLGSFPRILNRWLKKEPGANVRELVQRTLNSVHGVDINPFAIAIARFRLLLAALKACGIKRLADAPGFRMNLACGDSLYHGRQKQVMLEGIETDESHYFKTENAEELRRILKEGTFHAIVANPPYIVPKDPAANQAYRNLYKKYCHRKYSLSIPFMERIFSLAVLQTQTSSAGYVGQITSNSFMKREFGKKLIEDYFRLVDLTHILDVSGAYIPGHNGQEGGTSTVILFGRNRKPVSQTIRTIMGIQGEPGVPEDARFGLVWTAVLQQVDKPGSESRFISCADSSRESFSSHPWSLGGGGVSGLIEQLNEYCSRKLSQGARAIGYGVNIGEDDAFVDETRRYFKRQRIYSVKPMPAGEQIRDYSIAQLPMAIFPYDQGNVFSLPSNAVVHYWSLRVVLRNALSHKKTNEERGLDWRQYAVVVEDKLNLQRGIIYAFVATHNHFVFHRHSILSTKSAPAVYLGEDASDDDYLAIFGVLSSSTACFLMRNATYLTGGNGEPWQMRGQFSATSVSSIPLPDEFPFEIAKKVDFAIEARIKETPEYIASSRSLNSIRTQLSRSREDTIALTRRLIRLQEDLDWECYRHYGLLDDDLTYRSEVLGIHLGERAFEIVMARKMAEGDLTTTWFERHGSTPITELPEHWPEDYKALVNRRIEVIESNINIALIEQPEYKRRWNTESWESQVERALRYWLLDRLESYFDFDGRMNDENKPTAKFEIELTSVAKLADVARSDAQFMEVAEVFRNDPAFDVQRLVEELVAAEQVPLLPVLRYKPDGLRTRAEWETTWERQREEDRMTDQLAVLSRQAEDLKDDKERERAYANIAKQTKERDVFAASIPVPPKYKSSDFISTGDARYWELRGKLDVPKERWISFPHCEGSDGSLTIAWAGYNHLQLAKSISAFYMDVLERLGGSEDPRLVPLLGCLIELQPWLRQWHHDIDPEFNQRMDEVFDGFIAEQLKNLGVTETQVKAWVPPAKSTKPRKKAKE